MSPGPALHEPFKSIDRQREAAQFGMWVFLASEALFFGGLFLGFTVYKELYPQAMAEAGRQTNVVFGTINTAVLLTSSLTMAMADKAAERDRKRLLLWCLGLSAAMGLAFLVIKGFEYREDIGKHLVPGPDFALQAPAAQIFFSFYWVMTGVHAVHLSVGIAAIALLFHRVWSGRLPFKDSAALPVLALYWHLVDTIWIFLYPVLYLGGRA